MREVEFVPLSVLLDGRAASRTNRGAGDNIPSDSCVDAQSAVDVALPESKIPCSGTFGHRVDTSEHRLALREARVFRARLLDVFDAASGQLLRELAADVLARELQLAPCDIARVVARIAQSAPIVRVRVSAADVHALTGIAVVADDALAAGDAIVEVPGGAVDAQLGVRLADVLEAFR